MTEDEIERIDIKLAYLERANEELSTAVFRQQREIEELKARLGTIINEIEAAKTGRTEFRAVGERPPHY